MPHNLLSLQECAAIDSAKFCHRQSVKHLVTIELNDLFSSLTQFSSKISSDLCTVIVILTFIPPPLAQRPQSESAEG